MRLMRMAGCEDWRRGLKGDLAGHEPTLAQGPGFEFCRRQRSWFGSHDLILLVFVRIAICTRCEDTQKETLGMRRL